MAQADSSRTTSEQRKLAVLMRMALRDPDDPMSQFYNVLRRKASHTPLPPS